MNIFKTIFINSIIYKCFVLALTIYNESLLKVCCDSFVHIYNNSYISKQVNNYCNSVPIYKYSFIKKCKESIYYFIINNSEFLYNFVAKNIENSSIFTFIGKQVNETKTNKFKSVTLFLSLFLFSFTLLKDYMTYGFAHVVLFSLLGLMFAIMFLLSDYFVKIFYDSVCYKFFKYLLTEETYD